MKNLILAGFYSIFATASIAGSIHNDRNEGQRITGNSLLKLIKNKRIEFQNSSIVGGDAIEFLENGTIVFDTDFKSRGRYSLQGEQICYRVDVSVSCFSIYKSSKGMFIFEVNRNGTVNRNLVLIKPVSGRWGR